MRPETTKVSSLQEEVSKEGIEADGILDSRSQTRPIGGWGLTSKGLHLGDVEKRLWTQAPKLLISLWLCWPQAVAADAKIQLHSTALNCEGPQLEPIASPGQVIGKRYQKFSASGLPVVIAGVAIELVVRFATHLELLPDGRKMETTT